MTEINSINELMRYVSITDKTKEVRNKIMETADSEDIGYFRYRHSLRVASNVIRLYSLSNEYISETNGNFAFLLGIVHDEYKYNYVISHCDKSRVDHGVLAAVMFEQYITNIINENKLYLNTGTKQVFNQGIVALSRHSSKNMSARYQQDRNNYLKLLMDADALDKLSIEWINDTLRLFDKGMDLSARIEKAIAENSEYVPMTKAYKYLSNDAINQLRIIQKMHSPSMKGAGLL